MKRSHGQRFVTRAAAVVLVAAFAAASSLTPPAHAQDKPQKVVLRFAADFPPPPHPAGLAMKHFADRLPQVIPGSESATLLRRCAVHDPRSVRSNARGPIWK